MGKVRKASLLALCLLLVFPYLSVTNSLAGILQRIKDEKKYISRLYSGSSKTKLIGNNLQKNSNCNYLFYFGEGNNPILSYSGKISASKFLNPYKNEEIQNKIIRDLKEKEPKLIVK
jgi:hypothetical protein